MSRAPALVALVLLASTAAAFVRTQQQKLERSPVGRVDVDRVFSPVCRCDQSAASIGFRLRRDDRVTLEVVDGALERVRLLARDERVPKGDRAWPWDGRDDAGRLVPDGVYRPRLTLASGARTFVMQNPITVDTRAPRVERLVVAPRVFSPDGDRRRDRVILRYALDEAAHALLSVDGRRIERTRFRPLEGARRWSGTRRGKGLPPGRYTLALAAEDAAGNVGPARRAVVTIRYVELARRHVRVRPQTRFAIRVRADARRVGWRFAGGTGSTRPGTLVLRAPRRPDRYTLYVSTTGRGDRAAVVVTRPRARRPAPPRRAAP